MDLERRQSARVSTNRVATIRTDEGSFTVSCVVCNLSERGAKLMVEEPKPLPTEFFLFLRPGSAVGRRCQTIWRIGNKVVSCQCQLPISTSAHTGDLASGRLNSLLGLTLGAISQSTPEHAVLCFREPATGAKKTVSPAAGGSAYLRRDRPEMLGSSSSPRSRHPVRSLSTLH
jgi:hypothetical protein